MEYKYRNVELTPEVFKYLLILLFDGKQFDRSSAIKEITEYHKNNGGLLNHSSYTTTFKKASQDLQKGHGLVKVSYGIWKLLYKKDCVEDIVKEEKQKIEYKADKYLGEGDKSIYVYYYDKYRDYAVSKGSNRWECKIGKTDVNPLDRIFSQAGTCYPEFPHLALIIKCDNSTLVEKDFHNILKTRNRWIENSPGKEWFLTSPDEIEEIYNFIFQQSNK